MNKAIYTKVFLKEIGRSITDLSVQEHMPLWWQNTREKDHGGLRLTDLGFEIVNQIGITVYDIPFPNNMTITTQVIIFLDKFIDCPYYLTKNNVFVTSEKKAVELSLFSGDIRKFGLAKTLSKLRNSEDNG